MKQWQLAVSNKKHRDQFQCATHLTNGLSDKLACISALFQHDGWKAGQCLSDRSDCARIVMCMCTMVGALVRSLMRPQSSMTNRHGFSIFTWAKLRVPPPSPSTPAFLEYSSVVPGVQQGWNQSHHSLQRKASSDKVKYKPTALVRAMRGPVVHFVLLSTFFFSSQSFPTINLQSGEPTTTPESEPEKSLDNSEATTPEPEPEPEKPIYDSEPITSEPEPEPEKASDSSTRNSTTKEPTTPEPEPEPEKLLDDSKPTTPEPEPEPLNKLDGSKPKTTEPEPEPEKAYDSSKTTSSTTEPATTPEPEPDPENAVNPSKTTKEPTASPESEPEPEKSFDTSSSTHEPTTLPQPEPETTHVYSKTETKLSTEQETTLGTAPTTTPEKSDDRSTTYYTCMTCMTETTTTIQQKAEKTFDTPTRILSTKPEISAVHTKEVTNRPDPERTPKKRSELAIKKMPETMFEELVAKAGRFLRHEIPEGGVRKARKDTVHETNCETCVGLELEFDESLRTPSTGTKLIPFKASDARRPDSLFDGGEPELNFKFQRPRGARFNPGLTQRIRPIPIIPRPRSPKTNLEPRPRAPKTNLRPRRPRKQSESTSSSLWANLAWLGKTLYQYLSKFM